MWHAPWFRVTEDELRSLEVSDAAVDDDDQEYSDVALNGPFFVERKDRPMIAISLRVMPQQKALSYYDGWGNVVNVKGRAVFTNGKITFTSTDDKKMTIRKVTDADASKVGGKTVQDIVSAFAPDPDPEEDVE